jgi:hypothetical protein
MRKAQRPSTLKKPHFRFTILDSRRKIIANAHHRPFL